MTIKDDKETRRAMWVSTFGAAYARLYCDYVERWTKPPEDVSGFAEEARAMADSAVGIAAVEEAGMKINELCYDEVPPAPEELQPMFEALYAYMVANHLDEIDTADMNALSYFTAWWEEINQ